MDHPETSVRGGSCEALVVRHEAAQIRTELLGAREVDGVERSKIGRGQPSGRVEDAIVYTQQVHPCEHLPASSNRVGPKGKERARDLRPGKGT